MIRPKPRNKFLKDRTESNKKVYCKQRTFCAILKKSVTQILEFRLANNKRFGKP